MTLVVETVTGDTMAELLSGRDRETDADMVELRLDGVRDVDVAGALSGRRRPVVVTCRPTWEGGRFDGSEDTRLNLLAEAARLGAEFVDVEWRADPRIIERCRGARVVLSSHDFTGVPADLADRVRAMRAVGAALVKVAVTAHSFDDCTTLKRAVAGDEAHVAIAMGPAGQVTRLWPAWLGSAWTYGGSAAPGQIATRDLIHSYRVRTTTAATTPYAVVGLPVGHSASPSMHNAAFAALACDAVYVPVETGSAAECLSAAEGLGLAGLSVTAPLKEALVTTSVATDELPQRIGALNTLRRGPDGWEARNFDVAGFLAPLDRRSITIRERRAVVLGAGGAARAAVWALASHGAIVEVAARRAGAAQALASQLGVRTGRWPPDGGWDLLVNATPVGTWPRADESPVEEAALGASAGHVVYDLVYNPSETRLMRWARAAGAEVVGGLEMLVGQACRQFEWWTGQRAPRDVMDAAARAFLKGLEPPGLRSRLEVKARAARREHEVWSEADDL